MSKSDEASVLPIFGEPAEIKKKVMGIITDSKGVEDPKDPDESVIYQLYKLLAKPEESAEFEQGFRKGGMGYGDAKKKLLAKLEETFGGAMREKRKRLDEKPDEVEDVLVESARKARRVAARTMEQVYEATGIPSSKIKKEISSEGSL
jgi:tryptophanyl-tRNA synthetase